MKDIIKKVLFGILMVSIVLGAAVYRFMFYDPDKANKIETQPVVTDVAGTTYYAVTDPNTGSTMVVVTNENGEQFKAEFNDGTVGSTVAPVQEGEVQGELPTNYTGPHLDVSAPSTSSSQQSGGQSNQTATTKAPEASTTAPASNSGSQQNTPTSSSQTTTTTAPAVSQNQGVAQNTTQNVTQASGNKIDIYQQVFKSGNFLMKVNDPDIGDVTMAMKGNKMYVEASMEGMSLKLIYNGDIKDAENPDGTWYLMLDSLKSYSKMPAEMLEGMNVTEVTKGFAQEEENLVYTTDVVDVDGVLLVCESTTDGNGNTLNYYFDGDVLVRSETITPSGSATKTEFSMITTNVDDSLFAVPSDYKYLNLEWLMNLAGSSMS